MQHVCVLSEEKIVIKSYTAYLSIVIAMLLSVIEYSTFFVAKGSKYALKRSARKNDNTLSHLCIAKKCVIHYLGLGSAITICCLYNLSNHVCSASIPHGICSLRDQDDDK